MVQLELVVSFDVVDTLDDCQIGRFNLFAQVVLEIIDGV